MLQVYVIGCGGIGGYLINNLPMVISSLSLDLMDKNGYGITSLLENAGSTRYPCVVDTLTLVDADVFNPRNAIRQGMGAGSKLAQRMIYLKKTIKKWTEAKDRVGETLEKVKKIEEELNKLMSDLDLKNQEDILMGEEHLTREKMDRLQHEMVRVSCLQDMRILGYNEYIRPTLMEEIIPRGRKLTPAAERSRNYFGQIGARDITVVFMCVDNAATRYEVSKYLETFSDCIMINGGNSKIEGHVTIYERENGVELDPPLYVMYPDIAAGTDKRPDQVACTAVRPTHEQIAVTNSTIADFMMSRFVRWALNGTLTEKGNNGNKMRFNEVQIDIVKPVAFPVYHPHTETKV